jgi:hypothetical protein
MLRASLYVALPNVSVFHWILSYSTCATHPKTCHTCFSSNCFACIPTLQVRHIIQAHYPNIVSVLTLQVCHILEAYYHTCSRISELLDISLGMEVVSPVTCILENMTSISFKLGDPKGTTLYA